MRVKSFLATLLLMAAGLQTAQAQGFRVYKTDGTIVQFSFRTDSIVFYDGIGSDVDFGPFTPANQCIVGTWYKSKSETVTFGEDGTTDYIAGSTYEFLPYQGTLIINNADGKLMKLLRVPKVTKDYMLLSEWSGEKLTVLTTAQPGQLVTGITLSPASLTMQPNETTTIIATVLPADADNKEVEWASSDETVAVVGDFFGTITVMAKGYGTCTITATAKDGSGVKGECQVTVAKLVTGITLSPATLTLEVGKTQTLTANVQPSDATNSQVTWSSSNTSIATVSTSGEVTAVAPGECSITATAKDGSGVNGTCEVTVKLTGINGHEYVEIGGLKWATMNVGATTVAGSYETCYGDYFAYSETEPRYISITRTAADAATLICNYGYSSDYSPTYYSSLDADHDAATANWGGSWRTPNRNEFRTLAKACSGSNNDSQQPIDIELISTITKGGIYWLSSTQTIEPAYTGVAGLLFVSASDISKRVFFPASGYIRDMSLMSGGAEGVYWSSSVSTYYSSRAYNLDFKSSSVSLSGMWSDGNESYFGFTVRPVSD